MDNFNKLPLWKQVMLMVLGSLLVFAGILMILRPDIVQDRQAREGHIIACQDRAMELMNWDECNVREISVYGVKIAISNRGGGGSDHFHPSARNLARMGLREGKTYRFYHRSTFDIRDQVEVFYATLNLDDLEPADYLIAVPVDVPLTNVYVD